MINGEILVTENTIFENKMFGTIWFKTNLTGRHEITFINCSIVELKVDLCEPVMIVPRNLDLQKASGKELMFSRNVPKVSCAIRKDFLNKVTQRKKIGKPYVVSIDSNHGWTANWMDRLEMVTSGYYNRYLRLEDVQEFDLIEGKSVRSTFHPMWVQKYEILDHDGIPHIVLKRIVKKRKNGEIVKTVGIPYKDGVITGKQNKYYNTYVTYNRF